MFGKSLVIGAMSLTLMTAFASTASAAENTGAVHSASLPSKDSWGPWFKPPQKYTGYKTDRCRTYASVTAGSKIRFRAYVECKHIHALTVWVNGSMNGQITKSKGRACNLNRNWCDIVYKVNNKKGKQKWCGVVSSVTINGYWPGPKVTPRKPCIYY
ncbi:hypothetical protein GCM10023195_64640 [Actinoallomurus liliacearum]|uniref:Secreted protein n=2 Tax=Actinoallomurus liliacearum TaxID=1080073 RepID=A0ABP8TVP2_9ACTN